MKTPAFKARPIQTNLIVLAFVSLLTAHCSSCSSGPSEQMQHFHRDAGSGSGAGGAGTAGAGGGDTGGSGGQAEGLPNLPAPSMVTTPLFNAAGTCSMCHADNGGPAMKDAAGRNVSPLSLWRTSMMALSGRDPYFFAALSHEIAENPGAKDVIESTCTRCHAPEAAVTLAAENKHISLTELIEDTNNISALGREGVGCTLCHQIQPENLGSPQSFTGNYQIGTAREIYGPHMNPFANPMKQHVNYTPTYSSHIQDSALCATCHQVITHPIDANGNPAGDEVMEQVPYFEWQNSQFSAGATAQSCQSCHMPIVDQDGNPINTKLSNMPAMLNPRSPFGRHILAGGNAYMLELLSENTAWLNAGLSASDLKEGAATVRATLKTAASIEIVSASRVATELRIDVRVKNHTGHKFPTAYPSRRAWIRLTVADTQGQIVFESGRYDGRGALIDANGNRLDGATAILPHRQQIVSEAEVQVYEGVMKDGTGAPTHVLLRATGFAKDNRLLPMGYSAAHPNAPKINPIGIGGDPDYGANAMDNIQYRIANAPAGALSVEAELLFQTVPPAAFDVLAGAETPAANHFVAMGEKKPPLPIVVSSANSTVQ